MKSRWSEAGRRGLCLLAALCLLSLLLAGCGAEPTPFRLSPLSESGETGSDGTDAAVRVRTGHGAAVTASIPTPEPTPAPGETGMRDYVLNTSSKRFHLPDCKSVTDMKPENRKDVSAAREELLEQGYIPCGNCKP